MLDVDPVERGPLPWVGRPSVSVETRRTVAATGLSAPVEGSMSISSSSTPTVRPAMAVSLPRRSAAR